MQTKLLNFRPTSLVNRFLACAAIVMLSACGGGSNDNLTDTISTVTYTHDEYANSDRAPFRRLSNWLPHATASRPSKTSFSYG